MSDYVNHEMQDAWMNDDLANTDWGQLQEEALNEPWLRFDDFNWSAWEQPAEMHAADRGIKHGEHLSPPMDNTTRPLPQPSLMGSSSERPASGLQKGRDGFYCEFEGCKAGPYASKGTLTRHARNHKSTMTFLCPGQDCSMTFTRADKLRDHMLDGHTHDDYFICPRDHCTAELSRDLFVIHAKSCFRAKCHFELLEGWRKCPMPRCNFRQRGFFQGPCRVNLDRLQEHLLKDHDARGRYNFAATLAARGFDHETCAFLCPLCPEGTRFARHSEVLDHLKITHFPPITCRHHNDVARCQPWCSQVMDLSDQAFVESLMEHRRTILAIFPGFGFLHCKVWADIKKDYLSN